VRVRTWGLALLGAAAVAPITLAGVMMISRARHTTLDQAREANARTAERSVAQLAAFAHGQAETIRTVSNILGPAVGLTPGQADRVLRAYVLAFPNLRVIDVVSTACQPLGSSRLGGETRRDCSDPALEAALGGTTYFGAVKLDTDLAPVMVIAVPLDVAGERVGAAVADVNMEGIWGVVNEIKVGATGRARLIDREGKLIGHGDPAQRGRVFLAEKDPTLATVRAAAAGAGVRMKDSRGRDVLAVWAEVPELGWTLVVEQPVSEAFAAANDMQRAMLYVIVGALGFALLAGLLTGGPLVRGMEAMRGVVQRIGKGDWDARAAETGPDELRALARQLNEMVGELKDLYAKAAERARLDAFASVAAGLAHDLLLPIENAREAVQYALAHPDASDTPHVLRGALEADLSRLSRFVRDLRRLAREGDIAVALTSVDPGDVARKVVSDASGALRWAGVEFTASGSAATIQADADLVLRALSNLVANAADATVGRPGGKVSVDVRDDDGGVLFQVKDNGKGMSRERLAEVLGSQFRSDKRQSGVGLGLAVVRHVARAHGGAFEGDSVPGEGTTFRLRLGREPGLAKGQTGMHERPWGELGGRHDAA
jgi:signal transduction histidine kinase